MSHIPNLSVIENQVFNLEKVTQDMVNIQMGNSQTLRNLELNQALLQDNLKYMQNHYYKETTPKVTALWDNRSSMKGGWIVISVIGSMLVGAATIAGIAYEVLRSLIQH